MSFNDNFTKEDWIEEMRQEDREEALREAKHEYLLRTDPEYLESQPEFTELVACLSDFKRFCKSYDIPFSDMLDLAKDSI